MIAGAGIDRTIGRKILQLLVKDQTVAKINDGMMVDRAALDKLVADVRARKSTNPKLDIGAFKELTGLSRKFAVPLLEYLDGQRITRRIGDERVDPVASSFQLPAEKLWKLETGSFARATRRVRTSAPQLRHPLRVFAVLAAGSLPYWP